MRIAAPTKPSRDVVFAWGVAIVLFVMGTLESRRARVEVEDAPWALLLHIEECEQRRHGAEHSPKEIEQHILQMEKDAREIAEYEAELEEQRDYGTRF